MIRYQRRESRECNWQLKGHFAANSLKDLVLFDVAQCSMFLLPALKKDGNKHFEKYFSILGFYGILWGKKHQLISSGLF